MSLDILKKLIKLANHNPNENESNAAARKVCKMLEEDNFKLLGGGTITPPSPPPFTRPRAAPNDIDFEELVRRAREADAARRKQQEERERKAKEYPVMYHFQCSVCRVDITSRIPAPTTPLCLKCKYKKATGKEWGI